MGEFESPVRCQLSSARAPQTARLEQNFMANSLNEASLNACRTAARRRSPHRYRR